jgi:mono/diheme cytochrome c family protein
MKNMMKNSWCAAVLLTAGLSYQTAYAGAAPEATEGLLNIGEKAYMRECASCHGAEGDGEGLGAYILDPKPRNFQLAVYKLRSTPNGEIPTLGDLFKTISNGIPNSMMPSFKSLSEDERWGLVHHIVRLGEIEDEEAEPITVPSEPKVTKVRIDNGKKVYVELKCNSCHGEDGLGDGSSSLTLENDAKERVYPSDLTSGVFKGGSTGEDLYTRIATGLDGSPMPSYADEASSREIWDLVHYLQTLSKK